jgi:hypothetical protein
MLVRRSPLRWLIAALVAHSLAACGDGSSSDAPGSPNPTALAFQVQPVGVAAGTLQPTPIAVAVLDNAGQPMSAAIDVTLSIESGPADATMLGTTNVRSTSGVASFPTIFFSRAGTHRLRADAAGLAGTTSQAFDVSPGAPVALAFQVQPVSVAAGALQPAPVEVRLLDQAGTPTSAALDVTISIEAGPPDATILGTVTVASANGVAAFPSIAFTRAGMHHLRAEAAGLTGAASEPFEVSPGAPAALAFEAQPASGTVRAELSPAPHTVVRDAWGNHVDVATAITLAAQGGPSALAGTATRTTTAGGASFPGLSLADEGNYRLAATADGLDPALSGTFAVVDTVPPAKPADLATSLPTLHTLHVTWTETGDDGVRGAAAAWELRINAGPLTVETFPAATLVGAGTPLAAGMPESVDVDGLAAGTTYELGLKVVDGAGNSAYAFAVGVTSPCPAGYAGATCTDCAVGYVLDGGVCRLVGPPTAADVLITEVMIQPDGTQWFEVQNLSTTHPITLQGAYVWASDFTKAFVVGDVVLVRGGRAVFASATITGVSVAQVWPPGFSLPTGTSALRLETSSLLSIDTAIYTISSPTNASLQLSSAALAKGTNQYPWYWCASTAALPDASGYGTPGEANDDCGIAPTSPVDWCRIQFPATVTQTTLGSTTVGARVYELDVTTRNLAGNDMSPHLVVDIGYGTGTDPTAWTWAPAFFCFGYGPDLPGFEPNNDELCGGIVIPTAGSYNYGFRAALRDLATGALSSYVYCDTNGVVTDATTAAWGRATITP